MADISSLGNALYNTNYLFGANNKKQDSIAKLWSGYSSYQSNATEALAGLTEINSNVKALLASYDDAKGAFYSEFKENMSDLSASAAKVKDYNFNVDNENAITTTTTTDKDGKTTTSTAYSEELQAALNTVKDFVNNYNSSVKFFSDNAAVSKRVEMMGKTFSDTTYRAASYSTIGLTTNSDGSISINEEKLAQAILNDPSKVSTILGKDGLAGKAESHVSFANSQEDRLFPSAKEMLGDQLNTAAVYTGGTYANMSAINNVGNLLNMMF